MKCQHDPLNRKSTLLVETHPAVGRRVRCTVCDVTATISKKGTFTPDPKHLPHPVAVKFADGRSGCPSCGVYLSGDGRLVHTKDCELQHGSALETGVEP